MRTGLIGASAALAMVLAGTAAAAADPPKCEVTKIAELPVRFENNRPLVQVGVNGKPAWFLVDTGAQVTTLFGSIARDMGLGVATIDGLSFTGVGGTQDGQFAVVREFDFAGVKVKNMKMLVLGTRGGRDEAGLLGRDFLGHFDLEFDLANKVIRLVQPVRCGTQSEAYWADQAIEAEMLHDEPMTPYYVMMKINGRDFRATLDSGAQTSVITTDAAKALGVPLQALTGPVEQSRGIGAHTIGTRIGIFDKVAIGGEQISHVKLQVADLFKNNVHTETGSILTHRDENRDTPGMLLGADYLRSHRVLLSTSQKVFYATYNGGPIFQVVSARPPRPTTTVSPPG